MHIRAHRPHRLWRDRFLWVCGIADRAPDISMSPGQPGSRGDLAVQTRAYLGVAMGGGSGPLSPSRAPSSIPGPKIDPHGDARGAPPFHAKCLTGLFCKWSTRPDSNRRPSRWREDAGVDFIGVFRLKRSYRVVSANYVDQASDGGIVAPLREIHRDRRRTHSRHHRTALNTIRSSS
jgi:hypothetical protein